MKKLFIIFSVFFFYVTTAFGQGLVNYGALIVVQTGSMLKVDGDASGNYFNYNNVNNGSIDLDGVMEIDGDVMNYASNDVFINNNGDGWVKLNGNGAMTQTIGGSHLTIFENLEVNHNLFGAKCGITNNQVNGQLKLTVGPLSLNNFRFIVNNAAATCISRNGITETGSVVSESESSKLQWNIGSSTGTYIYPFGTPNADYIPFQASITAATGTDLTVSTWHTSVANNPYPTGVTNLNDAFGTDISITDVADRFWVTDYSGYSASFKFTYDNTGGTNDVGMLDESTFLAQSWNGTSWTAPPVGINDFANDNVNSVPGLPSPWVLINKTNPLPIELLSFEAVCMDDKITLVWATSSETNNDFFTVEKSSDGLLWQIVTVISGAGYSNNIINYTAEDLQLSSGNFYYRLKQTDFDGAFTYSNIIFVNCDEITTFELLALQQDISSNEIVLSFVSDENEQYYYGLYNITGQLLQQLSSRAVSGFNEVHLSVGEIAEGLYLITLKNNENFISQKIILK